MDEDTVKISMAIILNSGDARAACTDALTAIGDGNFDTADEKLKEAHKKIVEAHRIQTDAIQEETDGKKSEYSLLFAHAQDTVMTVTSELNIATQLLHIFKKYEKRISKLEDTI